MNPTDEETFIRFGQYAEAAMTKGTIETVQDELVLYSSLLLQDALSDQKMSEEEVEEFSSLIKKHLCSGSQPNASHAKNAANSIEVIKALYASNPQNEIATSNAATGLMSAVVLWLDANP